jgi:hypothetical protein
MMAMQPGIFGDQYYKFAAPCIVLMFVLSLIFFLKVLLIDYLKTNRQILLIVVAVLIFISIQLVYSPSQGFFWYNSAMYYTGFYSLAIFAFALLLALLKSTKIILKISLLIFAALLFFLVGGSNYIVALVSVLTLAAFLGCKILLKEKSGKWTIILCLSAALLGLVISGIAPGNSVRQDEFVKQGVFLRDSSIVFERFKFCLFVKRNSNNFSSSGPWTDNI